MVWVFLAFVAMGIISSVSAYNRKKKKSLVKTLISELPEFVPDRTLLKKSMSHGLRGLSVDLNEKKLCLIVEDLLIQVPFSKILESEVIVDGATVTKTSRTSQALGVLAGGALFGGVGAVVGGLSANTKSTQKIKNITLRLIADNVLCPIHDIGFIEIGESSDASVARALKEAQDWHATLKVIVFQGQKK